MSQPRSPTSQSFDLLDLRTLAQSTNKTFQRLAPYSQLQDPSSPDAVSTVNKIARKINQYLDAVDASVAAVHFLYRLSKDAAAFTSADTHIEIPLPKEKESSHDKDKQQQKASSSPTANTRTERAASLSSIGHGVFKGPDRKARLDGLATLADDAYRNAQKANGMFRQIEQDFYKANHSIFFPQSDNVLKSLAPHRQIAAATKDLPTEMTVQIPVDLSLPNLIKKPLHDIGTDLVSNLSHMSSFSRNISDLANWCVWVKTVIDSQSDISAAPQTAELNKKWNKVMADCLIYHAMIAELQEKHGKLLPVSTVSWQTVVEGKKIEKEAKRRSSTGSAAGRRKTGVRKVSAFLRDMVRYLACHGGGMSA